MKTAKWLWCGIAFAGAVLALLSPWTVASPFSGPLSLWVTKFLPLFLGGSSAMLLTRVSPLAIILPLVGSAVFVAPFLGLQLLANDPRHNLHSNEVALGIFLVTFSEIVTFILTKRVSWDPWQMIELATVVVFGLLLIRCGITMMRTLQATLASARLLGWLLLFVGICFSSFVLLPLGLLGMAVLYCVLGITFLQSPKPPHT